MFSQEFFVFHCLVAQVRGRAEAARRAGANELGASAIEWAIISALVVGLALGIFTVIKDVVDSNTNKIKGGM